MLQTFIVKNTAADASLGADAGKTDDAYGRVFFGSGTGWTTAAQDRKIRKTDWGSHQTVTKWLVS